MTTKMTTTTTKKWNGQGKLDGEHDVKDDNKDNSATTATTKMTTMTQQ